MTSELRGPGPAVSLAEATRVWARIGLLSFGGPAGQIALMHRVLVEERGWISERQFLHALNFCMLLPGPEAQQLATYVGWQLHRVRGGLIAGSLFVLPGFLVILALSYLYVAAGSLPVVQGLFLGLKAAVIAIVLQALVRIARRSLHGPLPVVVALAAFLAMYAWQVPFPWVIAVAALAGALAPRFRPAADDTAHEDLAASAGWRGLVRTVAIFGLAWLLPVAALLATLGPGHVFSTIATFFSKMAVVTFGGAYAVLAYVSQEAVQTYQWLMPGEMIDGLAMAETTPGPLIMVVQFVGFLAAYRDPGGLHPGVSGLLGALVTTWVTFAPCFLWIFAGAPYIERLRNNRWLAGALAGVTAAVIGVIMNLAAWFATHALFETVVVVERFGAA
ncbi:MAG: chromate efflux transporter, partial [Xanthomonadales bacterium]|nr:chromate efflux transporter [Xanthomonadales bacterium]